MDNLIHRTPSVGSLTKKMLQINPELSVLEIVDFIRQSTRTRGDGGMPHEFGQAQIVDEAGALELARKSLL